jgi:hypothetical protein
VIAYIRSVPSAGEATPEPPDQLNLLGVLMLGAGMLPSAKPVITGNITAPPKGPTFAFGEYILSYQDCRECHGRHLTGGVPGQIGPLGPDLNLVKLMEPCGIHRHHAHRNRSQRPGAQQTNAMASARTNG